jgi:hypothetical protein
MENFREPNKTEIHWKTFYEPLPNEQVWIIVGTWQSRWMRAQNIDIYEKGLEDKPPEEFYEKARWCNAGTFYVVTSSGDW